MGKSQWLMIDTDLINLNHVALVETDGNQARVHFALPEPEVPGGITYPVDSAPPVGTGHVIKYYKHDEWAAAWDQMARKSAGVN